MSKWFFFPQEITFQGEYKNFILSLIVMAEYSGPVYFAGPFIM